MSTGRTGPNTSFCMTGSDSVTSVKIVGALHMGKMINGAKEFGSWLWVLTEYDTSDAYQCISLLLSPVRPQPLCQTATVCPWYDWRALGWPCGRNCVTLWDRGRKTALGSTSGPAPAALSHPSGKGCSPEPPSSVRRCENGPRRCGVQWRQSHSAGPRNMGFCQQVQGWLVWTFELQPQRSCFPLLYTLSIREKNLRFFQNGYT